MLDSGVSAAARDAVETGRTRSAMSRSGAKQARGKPVTVTLSGDAQGFPPAPTLTGIAASAGLVGLAVLMSRWVLSALPAEALPGATLPLVFLVVVLIAAVTFGFWTGLFAALLAYGALNFLFTAPIYSFHIATAQDLFALLVFLLVAALSGLLAGRLHDQAEAARARADTLAVLGALSADLAEAESQAAAMAAATRHLAALCGGRAMVVDLVEDRPHLLIGETPDTVLSPADLAAADRCLRLGWAEPAAAPGWPGATMSFVPLVPGEAGLAVGHGRLGGREVSRRAAAIAILVEQLRLALQRLDFAKEAYAERLRAEAEATRSAVLTSLSHDLRTPLATILGSASALKDLDASLTPAARADLLAAIVEEADRLNGHVANLLQMTRLGLTAAPRLTWVDLNDIAAAAAARARRSFAGADIALHLAPELPMIRAEGGLLEQALFNLVDNGLHHGQPPVMLQSEILPNGVCLSVQDSGRGPTATLLAWLDSDEMRPASGQRGLGLAVAKGIAHHLGGRLTWKERAFCLTLPLADQRLTEPT